MKRTWKLGFGTLVVLGMLPTLLWGQDPKVRQSLEEAAANLRFYGLGLDANPSPERREFFRENATKLADIRKKDYDRNDLVALLKHQEPRARTLAALLLADLGNGKDLPLLAAMMKDDAPSFPRPPKPYRSPLLSQRPEPNGPRLALPPKTPMPSDPVERLYYLRQDGPKQTVGELVSQMIGEYMLAGGNSEKFEDYWAKRKGRAYCAGWFYVALQGAADADWNERPVRPRTVSERLELLPEPDRTFTFLWLRRFNLLSDEELVARCKKVGPGKLLELLQQKIPSDDPDLQWRSSNNFNYDCMITFVLENATQLLRPEDADAVLQAGQPQNPLHSKKWYLAALDLQPRMVTEVLSKATKDIETTKLGPNSTAPLDLGEAMWSRLGEASVDFTANMFYLQNPLRNDPMDRKGSFLRRLAPNLTINRKLIAAIVADKRFDTLDWYCLNELTAVANQLEENRLFEPNFRGQAHHPLGMHEYDWQKDVARKQYPKETEALETTLAGWRAVLRKAFVAPAR